MKATDFRKTTDDRLVASVRLLLAVLFLMTGLMKLLVPMLAEAWSGQLLVADLPFYSIARCSVPFVEVLLGVLLAVGKMARPAALAVIGIMLVATYVHVVVDDPSLFPLQPHLPIIPVVVFLMSAAILWKGAGAWSVDLRATTSELGGQ